VTDSLTGLDTSYPVTQLAVTIAVAATALPYLSRPLHRLVSFLVVMASIAAVVGGSALPVNAVSSLVLGWGRDRPAPGRGVTARPALGGGGHRLDRRPECRGRGHRPGTPPGLGVEKLTGHDAAGRTIELSVYGRDASDARMLAKMWRFCFYRRCRCS
jgi:hypothetical protein